MTTATAATIGDLARRWGLPEWRVRRLCDRLLPGVRRVGLYRVLDAADVARLAAALHEAGCALAGASPARAH